MSFGLDISSGSFIGGGASSGNATVPNDAAIQPPQAFVDMFVAQTTTGLSVANLHGFGIQSITIDAIQGWFNQLMEQEFALNGEVFPDWSNNALDVASVNGILVQVLGFAQEHVGFNGTLNLSGGTNAAPASTTNGRLFVSGVRIDVDGTYLPIGLSFGDEYWVLEGSGGDSTHSCVALNGDLVWGIVDLAGLTVSQSTTRGGPVPSFDVAGSLIWSVPTTAVVGENGNKVTLVNGGWTITDNSP